MPPRTDAARYYPNRSRWPFEQVDVGISAHLWDAAVYLTSAFLPFVRGLSEHGMNNLRCLQLVCGIDPHRPYQTLLIPL